MPKVPQFPYLSPQAMEYRRRDGLKPWQVHVVEVDSLSNIESGDTAFAAELEQARRLRVEIEATP